VTHDESIDNNELLNEFTIDDQQMTASLVAEQFEYSFSDEPLLNFSAAHEQLQEENSSDRTDQKSLDTSEERAATVLGGASENEANDALQTMIEEHLTAHHKTKVKDEANIATKSGDSEHSDGAQSQTDLAVDGTEPDESVGGSSSSHLDSLVAKPDDDSLPPI
ncbi:hypothetical protein, partial [Oleiphilus sp. HI0067]